MKLDRAVQLPADPVVLLNESSLFGDWQATVVERVAPCRVMLRCNKRLKMSSRWAAMRFPECRCRESAS